MSRPPPPVPANVDLTDFPFMPLLIDRLKRSRAWLICKRRPELAFYMLNLWTASWHSRPAASLENDDDVLADLAMCSSETWETIKADALRGWVECDDSKLYHPVIAEQALSAWERKVAQRARTEEARKAKLLKRQGQSPAAKPTDPVVVSVTESVAEPATALVTETVTGSKGQGQGQGQGDIESPEPPPASPPPKEGRVSRKARPAGELCPEEFKPSPAHYAKAAEWGRSAAWVNEIAERMGFWSRANADKAIAYKANWSQALHDWMRKHRDDGRPIMVSPGAGRAPSPVSGPANDRATSGFPSMFVGLEAGERAKSRRPN